MHLYMLTWMKQYLWECHLDTASKVGWPFKLNGALYGLRRSPLLWQQKLKDKIKKLGFEEIFEKSCVVQKNGIICFFYIDNIVFIFKKDQPNKFQNTVASFSKTITIERKKEQKWFLGLYIIRNQSKKSYDCHKKYILWRSIIPLVPVYVRADYLLCQ